MGAPHPHPEYGTGGSDVRAECQELGSVDAQPSAVLAPVWAMSLDERPELSRVVRDAQVAKLMHDHVVQHLQRCEYEPPVEGERAAWRARAPKSALPSYTDSEVIDADALSLLLGQRRNEFSRCRTRLGFADGGWVEAESRHLPTPLILDPRTLLLEQAFDVGVTRSPWHGEPRRLSPWHLQSPSPRPRRPPNLDAFQHARG